MSEGQDTQRPTAGTMPSTAADARAGGGAPASAPADGAAGVHADGQARARAAAAPGPAHGAVHRGPPGPPRPLWRTFLAFMGPMVLSNLLQSLTGTVNGIYLGQMLGVKALAAVSSFFPVLFFFIAFIIGLGAGASVLIGQAWGAREPERVKAVAGTTLAAGLLFGAVVAVFGGTFTEPMLRLLGTPPDVLPDAIAYARIMLLSGPGLFAFLLVTSMLRGVGDTVSPLLALTISTAVGLTITPALILGWGGLPRLGVASAAWATVIAYIVAMSWLAWRLLHKRIGHAPHPLAPDRAFLRRVRIDPALLSRVLRIGVPTGLQLVTVSLAEVALLAMVNGFGSSAVAAYGAVNQIVNYVQFPAISIAITCSILGAQAIGAGHVQRLSPILRTGLWMNVVMTGSLAVLGYLLSRSIIGLFVNDEAVIEVAQRLLHIMLWSFVLFGMQSATSGVMRASGTVMVPTLLSVLCIVGVEIPVAWVMSRRIGLDGVWWAYPITFAAMLAAQGGYYHFVWRKRPIKRLV